MAEPKPLLSILGFHRHTLDAMRHTDAERKEKKAAAWSRFRCENLELLAPRYVHYATTTLSAPGTTFIEMGVRPVYSPSVQTGWSGSVSIVISLPLQMY